MTSVRPPKLPTTPFMIPPKLRRALLIGFFVIFVLLALGLALGRWFGLEGWALGALLIVLFFVGFGIGYLIHRRIRAKRGGDEAEDSIDLLVAGARARLASTRGGKRSHLGRYPVILVVGPSSSTKTSIVVNSGLDPELLAGEVHRSEQVVPTDSANLWYTEDLVLVEAAGGLIDDPVGFDNLVRQLRPTRLSAAVGRGAQAPRTVVLCFPCDAFLQAGSSQSVPAAARTLRARLVEVAESFGIRLPVYVLFTKADQIPHFESYVRSLSREEAQQVLGATLPIADSATPGVYAERESARLTEAFRGIFRSLALHRLDILPREQREDIRGGAYEFPREVRKISDLATQFMVELCKPSQLGAGPFLRGFYFTGVRPIVVADTVAEASPAQSAAVPQIALGATSVFSLAQLQEQQQRRSAPVAAGTRRVPEWSFLKRVFRDIILQDRVVQTITAGGVRVNMLRRTMIGTAAALFLLLSAAFSISYVNNRALEQDALAAARGVEELRHSDFEAPSLEALQRLDALREQTARVAAYERAGHPWRLGWGLYTGSAIFPHLRQLYFDRFERLLWGSSRTSLIASLRALPASPNETSEFGTIYNTLKAHLITTTHPRESTPEFLTPVLMSHWFSARGLDAERLELARRQFDFFGSELPHGNPFRDNANEAVVTQTRGFLFKFADSDQLYQVLLAEAGREHEPVRFHQEFPGTEGVVRNGYEVPGAFTRYGWASVQATLADVDRLFARESWVVGERSVSPADRARLADELRSRYVADYIRHWQEYLRAGTVASGGGIPEIAQRLERHSGNQPPLMQMFSLASRHTDVDTADVRRAFQPLHLVVPPDMTDRFVGESNAGYVQALGGLHDALSQATTLTGAALAMAVQQAAGNVEQVRGAVRSIGQGFAVDGPAREVGGVVQRLMLVPVTGIDGIAQQLPAGQLNAAGASFCSTFRPVVAKYPFTASAGAQASLDEVMGAFQPGASSLWSFYSDALQEVLDRRGRLFGARVGATPQPTAAFVNFFNRATTVSRGMFDETGAGPEITFLFRPQTTAEIPEITVTMDGRSVTYTRTEAGFQPFTWDGARARGFRISGRINGVETPLLEGQGLWGVFQVFGQAAWSASAGDRQTVQWRVQSLQQPLVAEVSFARGVPIFNPALLSVGCISTVAQ
jgi:type VI secretion system protein ImpL